MLNIQFNYSFAEVLERMRKGERLMAALLNNMQFQLLLTIHSNLAASLQEVVKNIHDEFNKAFPMQVLKYFKNFDIDVAFESTDHFNIGIKN